VTAFPAGGVLASALFVLAAGAMVAGALIAALATRVIRGVCGLALCCLGLAGLYYFLQSPFLALMEILIYIGAVCVTIVLAVMLAEPDEVPGGESRAAQWFWTIGAIGVGGLLFWGLARAGIMGPWVKPATRLNEGSVEAIGVSLLTTYSMAFELISLVLLVAILGALAIARQGRHRA